MNITSSLHVLEKIFVIACSLALKGAAAAVVSAPLTFTSNETLTVELGSKFNLMGLLELTVANLEDGKFKIKAENDSPDFDFQPNSSIDRGIFCKKRILGFTGPDPSFPAGKTRPTKDESSVPIKINCGTSVVGEQTKVQIAYDAFKLFDLENVQISVVPIKAGKAEIQKPIIGRAWYYPGESIEHSKVHWSLLVIDDSNRYGSLELFVPGAVDVSKNFPHVSEVQRKSTYSNLSSLSSISKNKMLQQRLCTIKN